MSPFGAICLLLTLQKLAGENQITNVQWQPSFRHPLLSVLKPTRFRILLFKCEGGCCKNVVYISSAVVNSVWNCAAGTSQFAFVPLMKTFDISGDCDDVVWSVMSLEPLPAEVIASFFLGFRPPGSMVKETTCRQKLPPPSISNQTTSNKVKQASSLVEG